MDDSAVRVHVWALQASDPVARLSRSARLVERTTGAIISVPGGAVLSGVGPLDLSERAVAARLVRYSGRRVAEELLRAGYLAPTRVPSMRPRGLPAEDLIPKPSEKLFQGLQ